MAHVVVTRPAGQERELVERLRAAGHEVTHVPLVAIEPLGDEPVDVDGYDWVVLTSANGARELRRRMRGTPPRVAAIGRATADAFGGADLVAATSTQEGLLAALPEPRRPRAVRRRRGRAAAAAGDARRRRRRRSTGRSSSRLPDWPDGDLVVLASPSAARAYGRLGRRARVRRSGRRRRARRASGRRGGGRRGRRPATSTVSSPRSSVRSARRRLGPRWSSASSPTSGSRTTSSAPATA